MKIIVLTTWLAPYRVDLYNELAKYADVTVMYEATSAPERNSAWGSAMSDRCKYIQVKQGVSIPMLGKSNPQFINEIATNGSDYDVIYIDGYSALAQLQAIKYLSHHKIHYFVNVDGALIRDNEPKLLSWVKKWILNRDCSYLCGAKVSNDYLMRYGVRREQIFNHPFTSLFESDIIPSTVNREMKLKYRVELGMKEENIILSVGRFSYKKGYGKGYDALLRAASRMPKNFGFYIVGDEPTDEFVEMKQKLGAENVHFVGFKQKAELTKYYQAADIFVLMTVYDVWGLVVNEAMANGLPVITTDMCVAGLDLINNGGNGYIVPVGDDKALEQRIYDTSGNPENLAAMSANALETIRPYTIENVANCHLSAFKTCVK